MNLWLELTPNCNLSCAFCYNPWRPKSKSEYPAILSPDLFERQVSRLLELGSFEYAALSGGEPLLYRSLGPLIESIAYRGTHTILTTNGRLGTARRLAALHRGGLNGIQVSLLGARPATHDAIAGRASWRQAVSCLISGLELGLDVSATFVATAGNIDELPLLARLLNGLGVRSVVVNEVHLVGSGTGERALEPAADVFDEVTTRVAREAAAKGTEVIVLSARRLSPAQVRESGWHRLALSSDGSLKICNQSVRTIGRATAMSDSEISTVLQALEQGDMAPFAAHVDHCDCLRALDAETAGRLATAPRRSGAPLIGA